MTEMENLIAKIKKLQRGCEAPLLVALDGRSGVGKSTLSAQLAKQLRGVVIKSDDFYAGAPGGSEQGWDKSSAKEKAESVIDWKRLRREALKPLLISQIAFYRSFDWEGWARAQQPDAEKNKIGLGDAFITLNPASLIILDGAYSTRPELADLIDLKVLVEVPDGLRRQRLLEREGQEYMGAWHARWDTAEDYYFTYVRPRSSFDLVITNS